MEGWHTEIIELHEFFEAYFLATISDDIGRLFVALAPEFTMIGPNGDVSSRSATMAAVTAGYGHTESLEITTSDHRMHLDQGADGILIASYVETHALASRMNHRRTTAVFRRHYGAPNGLQWVHAHECWIDRGMDRGSNA